MISAALAVLETEEQRNALSALYNENEERYLKAALSKLHNLQDAEDTVQEAFLQIASNPELFFKVEPKQRAYYAYIIVRNVAVDLFKSKNKVVFDEYNEDLPCDDYANSLEDEFIAKTSRNELMQFIQNLPELQRDVLALRCLQGLSIAETAERLNISQAAVKKRLHCARKAIFEFVNKEENNNE